MSEETGMTEAEAPKAAAKQRSKEDSLALRYRIIFVCIAAFALACILLLSILPSKSVERAVRRNADAVLAERFSSVFPGRDAPVTGTRVFPKSGGAAFQFVFLAQGQTGQSNTDFADELIFIVPVSGISGPASSIFYYSQDGTLRFIGNSARRAGGLLFDGAPPAATEISASNLRKWQAKIGAVAAQILMQEARR